MERGRQSEAELLDTHSDVLLAGRRQQNFGDIVVDRRDALEERSTEGRVEHRTCAHDGGGSFAGVCRAVGFVALGAVVVALRLLAMVRRYDRVDEEDERGRMKRHCD
jgi:hypothetical protein